MIEQYYHLFFFATSNDSIDLSQFSERKKRVILFVASDFFIDAECFEFVAVCFEESTFKLTLQRRFICLTGKRIIGWDSFFSKSQLDHKVFYAMCYVGMPLMGMSLCDRIHY